MKLNLSNKHSIWLLSRSWWRHQMETFSALLPNCAGKSPVTGEFPAQRPLTRSFDVFFDLHLHKQLTKQWSGRWFQTPSRPLWRHCIVAMASQITSRSIVCSIASTSSWQKSLAFLILFRNRKLFLMAHDKSWVSRNDAWILKWKFDFR